MSIIPATQMHQPQTIYMFLLAFHESKTSSSHSKKRWNIQLFAGCLLHKIWWNNWTMFWWRWVRLKLISKPNDHWHWQQQHQILTTTWNTDYNNMKHTKQQIFKQLENWTIFLIIILLLNSHNFQNSSLRLLTWDLMSDN